MAWLVMACSSHPPEGRAVVEVDLPEQALRIEGGPVAYAGLLEDRLITANLLRVTGPIAMHHHLESEEVVYLISGEGTLTLADGVRALKAGDFVVIPRNTVHGFTPTGTEPAVVLSLFTPPQVKGDRIFEE